MTIRDLLFSYWLALQKERGDDVSWKAFSEHVGIDHVYLNKIYNGKRNAGEKTIEHLAKFFNDMRFFDVANMPRPDPQLQTIIHSWKNIPPSVRDKISEETAPYSVEDQK